MRISPAPVLKYGGRRTVKSSVSSLVPVGLLTVASPATVRLSDANLFEGTGDTITGTGQFLKSVADDILVVLADPEGSALYDKVIEPSGCSNIVLVTDPAL
jgi:hypothetical protein